MSDAFERALQLAWKRGHICSGDNTELRCARCRRTAKPGPDGRPAGDLLTRDCGKPSGVSVT